MKLAAYLRSIGSRFLRRSQVEDEMAEELRSHIQLRADDLERSGLDRAEAERRARVEFGARERFKEESYQALGGNFLDRRCRSHGSAGPGGNLDPRTTRLVGRSVDPAAG